MDIRSTFRNRLEGAMRGRNEVGQPAIGCAGSIRLGVEACRKIRKPSRGDSEPLRRKWLSLVAEKSL
jgi:hypothetical protein